MAVKNGIDGVLKDIDKSLIQATGGKYDLGHVIGKIPEPNKEGDSTGEGIARRIAEATDLEALKYQVETIGLPEDKLLGRGLEPILVGMNIKHNELERVKELTIAEILKRK